MPVEGFFNDYDWSSLINMEGAEAFLIVMLGITIIVWLINSIFSVIGRWKMFKKAGKEGWPAFIPIYNTVVLCEVTGVNPWWILIIIIARIISSALLGIGLLLGALVTIYFKIILYVSTARSYGKDDSWAVGLYFLKPFFFFALGVGGSTYQGAKPLQDPILGEVGTNSKKDNTPEAEEVNEAKKEIKFCPNCGSKITEGAKFCINCGKQI